MDSPARMRGLGRNPRGLQHFCFGEIREGAILREKSVEIFLGIYIL